MIDQLLLVGEDQFFHSREIFENHNIVHVGTSHEALSLIDNFDFSAIVAREGSEILKEVRVKGKHTPFLNITHAEAVSDCCGGHMAPEATDAEKREMLGQLMKRNHQTDCC
jgi:hypothetical protein